MSERSEHIDDNGTQAQTLRVTANLKLHVNEVRRVKQAPRFWISLAIELFLSLCLTVASPGLCAQMVKGAAGMYVRLPDAGNSTFSANLALRLQKRNKAAYATWIMLVANGDRTTTSFVQCGLLRWSKSGYGVVPFIAYHKRGGTWGFVASAHTIRASNASSSITIENGMLILSVAGKTHWRHRLADFFDMREFLYYEVADEVSAYGDSLSGIISGLRLSGEDGRQGRVTPRCGFADSGLSIAQISSETWAGQGVFRKGAGRAFSLPSGATVSSCRLRF